MAEWAGFVNEGGGEDRYSEFALNEGDEGVIVQAVVGVASVIGGKWLG